MPKQNVENKQRAIHKCENVSDRFATDSHTSQQKHASAREQQSGKIAHRPHAERRQRNWSEKLNRSHRSQRQSIDRQIKKDVHDCQHET
jgi:hypothetical protein